MDIEHLKELTDEIDQTICHKLFKYHKPTHFGATSFGNELVDFSGCTKLCWFGEYDMGYTLLVNIGKHASGTQFDLIKVYIDFGEYIDNQDEYTLQINLYNQKIKSNDWTEDNLIMMDTYVGNLASLLKSKN